MSKLPALAGQTPAKGTQPADLFEADVTIDPKWAVLAVALAAFALAASYDFELGLAAGAGLGAMFVIYLTIRLTFAFEKGQEGSNRGKLAQRFSKLARNRREAQQKETSANTRKD